MSTVFVHNIRVLITPLPESAKKGRHAVAVIPNAAILIEDERITVIGEETALANDVRGCVDRIDAEQSMVLPGLIDCHTHPVFVGGRADEFHLRNAGKSYLEIAAAGGGIQASARKVRAASVEQLVREAIPRLRRSLQCGVTTLEGKSGYGLTWEGEFKLLQALEQLDSHVPQRLYRTFLIHALPEEYKDRREEFRSEVVEEMLPAVKEQKLATAADVFCESGAFTVDESRAFLTRAKELGFELTIHANQFGNSGGALLAAELLARSADHLEYLNDEEMRAMCDADVTGVILPACVFFLGTIPYPPARAMLDCGMKIAIATDMNPGTAMTESLPFCMTAAAIYCKMTPEELLHAVTLTPAETLGVARDAGSIEIGKYADLTFWKMPGLSSLSYHFGATEPVRVMIGGKTVHTNSDATRAY